MAPLRVQQGAGPDDRVPPPPPLQSPLPSWNQMWNACRRGCFWLAKAKDRLGREYSGQGGRRRRLGGTGRRNGWSEWLGGPCPGGENSPHCKEKWLYIPNRPSNLHSAYTVLTLENKLSAAPFICTFPYSISWKKPFKGCFDWRNSPFWPFHT